MHKPNQRTLDSSVQEGSRHGLHMRNGGHGEWKLVEDRDWDTEEVDELVIYLSPAEIEQVKSGKKTLLKSGKKKKPWMRNKKCVCGSGKKFKKCCWGKYL